MKLLCLSVLLCSSLTLSQAAVKNPYRQLGENDSGEDKECSGLKGNVSQLWQEMRELRSFLADHLDHNKHHDCQQESQLPKGGNLLGEKNVVTSLVGGVQKPVIGITETLTSDYFPFPENSHRQAEHFPNQGSGHGGIQPHSDSFGTGNMNSGPHHHSANNNPNIPNCRDFRHASAFMRPPRFRNVQEYDFAACHMRPNPALSAHERGNVFGIITLSQKKDSKTLTMGIRLSGFNVSAKDETHHGDGGKGSDRLREDGQSLGEQHRQQVEKYVQETIKTGTFSQLNQGIDDGWSTGHLHGFHVHEFGDIIDGCDSAGGHYNPYRLRHGGPSSRIRHVGDFGNIDCDDEGSSNLIITDEVATLRGQYSIIGKSLVVHADRDDLGSNPRDQGSSTTGNAGARLACCVIERIDSASFNDGRWAQGTKRSADIHEKPQEEHHQETEKIEQKHH